MEMNEETVKKKKIYFGTRNNFPLNLNKECFGQDSGYDVILVTKDGKEFKSRRKLLGSVSIFFDRMFKAEMKEQYDMKVNIKNINSDIMQIVLDFIYTSSVAIDQSNAVELLAAADYLEIEELGSLCVRHILSTIDETNCIPYYSAGIMYNLVALVDRARKIVVKNFEEVANTESFKASANVDVVIDCIVTFNANDSVMKANTAYKVVMGWINYNLEIRKQHCLKLLKVLKPCLFPSDYLKEVVLNNQLIKSVPTCTEFIQKEIYWKSVQDDVSEKSIKTWNKFIGVSGKKTKMFDIFSAKWKDLPDLDVSADGSCIVAHEDKIYLIGGNDHSHGIKLLQFENNFSNWKAVGTTIKGRKTSKAISYKGLIVICGGDETFYSKEQNQLQDIAYIFKQLKEKISKQKRCPLKKKEEIIVQLEEDVAQLEVQHKEKSEKIMDLKRGAFTPAHSRRSLFRTQTSFPCYLSVSSLTMRQSPVELYLPLDDSHFLLPPVVHGSNPVLFKSGNDLYYLAENTPCILQRYSGEEWMDESTMKEGLSGLKCGLCFNGNAYFVGLGTDLTITMVSYSVKYKGWRKHTSIKKRCSVCDCLAMDGEIYLLGRNDQNTFLLKFSPTEESWKTIFEETTKFAFSTLTAI